MAQANERTLLAWLRTGVGLMAFGFVVARSGPWLRAATGGGGGEGGGFAWAGIALILLGVLFSLAAGVEYTRLRRALLAGRVIGTGAVLPVLLTILVALMGALLIVLLALRSL